MGGCRLPNPPLLKILVLRLLIPEYSNQMHSKIFFFNFSSSMRVYGMLSKQWRLTCNLKADCDILLETPVEPKDLYDWI